jgi:hypothetical protein
MRSVTLTKLGTPGNKQVSITSPYNGDEFEFLSPEWRALARQAAATESGIARDGKYLAQINH